MRYLSGKLLGSWSVPGSVPFLIFCNYYRIGGASRNEFRMARGGSSGDRARGTVRGRAFKKTPIDRDSNTETSYYATARPKFQESLKNQENSQGKYYDDKRINGLHR